MEWNRRSESRTGTRSARAGSAGPRTRSALGTGAGAHVRAARTGPRARSHIGTVPSGNATRHNVSNRVRLIEGKEAAGPSMG